MAKRLVQKVDLGMLFEESDLQRTVLETSVSYNLRRDVESTPTTFGNNSYGTFNPSYVEVEDYLNSSKCRCSCNCGHCKC